MPLTKLEQSEIEVRQNMNNYHGVIIEESLEDKSVLKKVKIVSTKIENVSEKHRTPWISKWTLHSVEVPESEAEKIANEISSSLDREHSWYADFRNNTNHYIIFRNRVFSVNRMSKDQYEKAKQYGISIGIPEYQVDFSPHVKEWKR